MLEKQPDEQEDDGVLLCHVSDVGDFSVGYDSCTGSEVVLLVPDVADSEVSCVFMESCILPCSFQGGTDVVIHWVQLTVGHLVVHSFYHNQDQLGHQVQRFRDRTSLFKDQISRGNASLQLTGVEVQDQGRYKCHPSTIRGNKDSFINLKVDAPVDEVDLQQVENRTTCSSEGIYPQPELTWSTSPPSNLTFKKQTEVQKTEQLLYNISSSLIPSDTDTDVGYSCTVSTRRNRKRATLFKSGKLTIGRDVVVIIILAVVVAAAVVVALVLHCIKKKGQWDTNNTSLNQRLVREVET
ncbi:V-set domain-containing T-cell activation inhibitor 1-like [Seriola dumerili]|uniref:V-set domain-containing T-cell activation inhibitor 1-like n=1 Tax=Seriola dumerili TaxID=41447 RepID=UPI000BBEDE59|nr:V-set domain-containing T-cell activation inhibitor 1-like [Seriola dumerili]